MVKIFQFSHLTTKFLAFLRLACSSLRDSGKSLNWENEREKPRGVWGETRPAPFLQIPRAIFSRTLSNFKIAWNKLFYG